MTDFSRKSPRYIAGTSTRCCRLCLLSVVERRPLQISHGHVLGPGCRCSRYDSWCSVYAWQSHSYCWFSAFQACSGFLVLFAMRLIVIFVGLWGIYLILLVRGHWSRHRCRERRCFATTLRLSQEWASTLLSLRKASLLRDICTSLLRGELEACHARHWHG